MSIWHGTSMPCIVLLGQKLSFWARPVHVISPYGIELQCLALSFWAKIVLLGKTCACYQSIWHGTSTLNTVLLGKTCKCYQSINGTSVPNIVFLGKTWLRNSTFWVYFQNFVGAMITKQQSHNDLSLLYQTKQSLSFTNNPLDQKRGIKCILRMPNIFLAWVPFFFFKLKCL